MTQHGGVKHTLKVANGVELPAGDFEGKKKTKAYLDVRHRLAFVLTRISGQAAIFWFEYLVASLMSRNSESEVRSLNPFLPEGGVKRVQDLVVGVLLRASRSSLPLSSLSLASYFSLPSSILYSLALFEISHLYAHPSRICYLWDL